MFCRKCSGANEEVCFAKRRGENIAGPIWYEWFFLFLLLDSEAFEHYVNKHLIHRSIQRSRFHDQSMVSYVQKCE